MHSKRVPFALTAALMVAGTGGAFAAAPTSGQACAPPGVPHPQLFVQPMTTSFDIRLRLSHGPPLGDAVILIEDPSTFGLPDPRPLLPGCAANLRGVFALNVILDAAGSFNLLMPPGMFVDAPRVSVICIPVGGWLTQSSYSNTLVVSPPQFGTSSAPGGPHVGIAGTGVQPPEVVIVEFMKDPTTVSDSHGEWIELWNPTGNSVNVEGLVLSDFGSDATVLDNGGAGLLIPSHGFLVIGRDDDTTTNGGVPIDYEYSGTTLSNGDDEIVLSTMGGIVVDVIQYDDGMLWPDSAGRSISLDPSGFDASANDEGANWCHSSMPLGAANSDTGTPGAMNEICP